LYFEVFSNRIISFISGKDKETLKKDIEEIQENKKRADELLELGEIK
jgi:hypothetical protein